MLYAKVNGLRQRAERGARGECPGCGRQVLAKCGEIVIHHWAHFPDPDSEPCAHGFGESPWHLDSKDRIERFMPGVGIEVHDPEIGRFYDALMPPRFSLPPQLRDEIGNRAAVEFQQLHIKRSEMKWRELASANLVWIFNLRDAYDSGEGRLSVYGLEGKPDGGWKRIPFEISTWQRFGRKAVKSVYWNWEKASKVVIEAFRWMFWELGEGLYLEPISQKFGYRSGSTMEGRGWVWTERDVYQRIASLDPMAWPHPDWKTAGELLEVDHPSLRTAVRDLMAIGYERKEAADSMLRVFRKEESRAHLLQPALDAFAEVFPGSKILSGPGELPARFPWQEEDAV